MSNTPKRKRFSRRTITALVLLDQELYGQHAALELELARAMQEDPKHNRPDEAPAIAARVLELEERINVTERLPVSFVGIGRHRWELLAMEHRATEEQAEAGYDFDPTTFPAAAFLASWSNPEAVDDELMEELGLADRSEFPEWAERELTEAQWREIWQALLLANIGDESRPKSLIASATAHVYDAHSTTPRHED